jgi:outer membrane protein OmpA-like peptidoglycan-associated protein
MLLPIQGHTDDVGEENKNLVLSENRAKSVMNYLATLGVNSERLKAKGFGETKPKVPNSSGLKFKFSTTYIQLSANSSIAFLS